ncbi:MAG: hypothetical protein HWN69_03445 [Desulfobacterales bacterium]|nr:hypothetical protein [Desulfobacterales bacterium]
MLEQYFGVGAKKGAGFLVLVLGTAAIVTGIYSGIFGFDRWQNEMQRASDLMMVATVAPQAPVVPAPSGFGMAGQYVCPRDGAVGLPNFDAAGVPHCPVCGQVMNFHNALTGNMTLAAGFG